MNDMDTPPMTAISPTDAPITLEGALEDLQHLTESVARAFDCNSNVVEQHLLVEEAKKLAKKYGAHN